MLACVCLNPSFDRTVSLRSFTAGDVNRVLSARQDVGGKGINVSGVLAQLGCESVALGFVVLWPTVLSVLQNPRTHPAPSAHTPSCSVPPGSRRARSGWSAALQMAATSSRPSGRSSTAHPRNTAQNSAEMSEIGRGENNPHAAQSDPRIHYKEYPAVCPAAGGYRHLAQCAHRLGTGRCHRHWVLFEEECLQK